MKSLATSYMGLSLKSPVILASGPLTSNLTQLYEAEKAGAGAVVLKSLFEEQIEKDASSSNLDDGYMNHADSHLYYETMQKDWYIDRYMDLLEKAKKALSIPVIASVNCRSVSSWIDYSSRFEKCGADALELNWFPLATDPDVKGSRADEELLELARRARKSVKIPLSIKLSSRYSSLPWIVEELEKIGVDAVVFFNRPWKPDIDIDDLRFVAAPAISSAEEYHEALRWTALISAETKMDIAGNTGIHSAETLIKMLLAGASAVEVLSICMKDGLGAIGKMNEGLSEWMEKRGYNSIEEFKALLAEENRADGDAWERVQFLKTIGN